MKRAGQALAICVVVSGGFWATSTRAYQAPDAKAALAKDDSCITCHGGTGHVADIYQSRHGNKADPRTPGCVNCHGASDKHMTDPAGIAPDVVFAATSKRRSPAAAEVRRLSPATPASCCRAPSGPAVSTRPAA
jgi:hypothetical protein